MNNENWVIELTETDNEIWHPDEEGFATREEAIEIGTEMAKKDGLKSFRIGRRVDVGIPNLDTEDIIERLQDQIYDEVGEVGEDYLDNVTEEHQNELEEKLNEVFYQWSVQHGYAPSCYHIYDEEVIRL